MLAEGIFILTVSLSGNYDDLEFVGYFNDWFEPLRPIYDDYDNRFQNERIN